MRKSKFTEHQIVSMLKQHEAGAKVADICREHGISNATFYQWKAKYGGLDASQLKLVKDLQEENSRLKRMYAELSMMHDSLKQVVEKKWGGLTRSAISCRPLSPSMDTPSGKRAAWWALLAVPRSTVSIHRTTRWCSMHWTTW